MRTLPLVVLVIALGCGGSSSDDTGSGGDTGTIADTSSGDSSNDTTPGSDTSPTNDTSTGDTTPPPIDTSGDVENDIHDAPTDDTGTCSAGGAACSTPLSCCEGKCVYEQNDPLNCGGCGTKCSGDTSMCEAGHCVAPTCPKACPAGSVCCDVPGPGPATKPACYAGDTCPIGCPLCK